MVVHLVSGRLLFQDDPRGQEAVLPQLGPFGVLVENVVKEEPVARWTAERCKAFVQDTGMPVRQEKLRSGKAYLHWQCTLLCKKQQRMEAAVARACKKQLASRAVAELRPSGNLLRCTWSAPRTYQAVTSWLQDALQLQKSEWAVAPVVMETAFNQLALRPQGPQQVGERGKCQVVAGQLTASVLRWLQADVMSLQLGNLQLPERENGKIMLHGKLRRDGKRTYNGISATEILTPRLAIWCSALRRKNAAVLSHFQRRLRSSIQNRQLEAGERMSDNAAAFLEETWGNYLWQFVAVELQTPQPPAQDAQHFEGGASTGFHAAISLSGRRLVKTFAADGYESIMQCSPGHTYIADMTAIRHGVFYYGQVPQSDLLVLPGFGGPADRRFVSTCAFCMGWATGRPRACQPGPCMATMQIRSAIFRSVRATAVRAGSSTALSLLRVGATQAQCRGGWQIAFAPRRCLSCHSCSYPPRRRSGLLLLRSGRRICAFWMAYLYLRALRPVSGGGFTSSLLRRPCRGRGVSLVLWGLPGSIAPDYIESCSWCCSCGLQERRVRRACQDDCVLKLSGWYEVTAWAL